MSSIDTMCLKVLISGFLYKMFVLKKKQTKLGKLLFVPANLMISSISCKKEYHQFNFIFQLSYFYFPVQLASIATFGHQLFCGLQKTRNFRKSMFQLVCFSFRETQ